MAQRIRRFAPGQAARVLGILYAIMGAIVAPFFIAAALFVPDQAGFGIGFAIALPLIYGVVGAVAVAICCALYNLVAGWVGGIEVELQESSGTT